MVPVPGGVLIRDAARSVIGAVGISGDASDNDEFAAWLASRQPALSPIQASRSNDTLA